MSSPSLDPKLIFRSKFDPRRETSYTPTPSRYPSPITTDDESDSTTLYTPSPSPSPCLRPTRARLAKQASQRILFSRSPTPMVERTSSPAPSSFSASPSVGTVKMEKNYTGPKPAKKRSSGSARKGEPRRCQNMIAQKKYRDKKVQASALVSL